MNKKLSNYLTELANEEYNKMEKPLYCRQTWIMLYRHCVEKQLRRFYNSHRTNEQGTYLAKAIPANDSSGVSSCDSLFDLIDEQHQYFDIGIVQRVRARR